MSDVDIMSFTVDWDEALASVNHDRSLLKLVIDAFLRESVELQERIELAIRTRDAALLQRCGHTLKGTMLSLGAAEWSNIALRLEQLGEAGTTDGAAELAASLKVRLPLLREQLGEFTVEQVSD